MKTIAIALSTGCVLALCVWSLSGPSPASAATSKPSVTLSLISGSVTCRADNTFDFVLGAKISGSYVIGTVDFDTALGTYGASHVTFSPNYFFSSPDVAIRVSGVKTILGTAWVSVKVTLFPGGGTATYVQEIKC